MPDLRVLHLATDELDCLFETDTGFLRKIRRGETEIVRAIYAAVRDENWNTVEPSIDVRRVHVKLNGFRVEFDARCQAADICFCWSGSIEAQGPKLTFTFKGEARSSFRKNRIGFCVLHPIRECAALPCSIQDTRGKWSEAFFPEYISPHQPFKDLRGLRWSPRPGVKAELIFQGDVFETEDQRNWTDASFKTYCTPLAHPFPVLIEVGTKVYQQVTLDLESEEPVHPAKSKVPEIELGKFEVEVPMPRLGLGMSSHGHRLSQMQLQRLKKLRLNHLRVDLRLARDTWVNEYGLAVEEAAAIGARLQAALFVTDNAFQELGQFRHLMDPALLDSCLIFHEKEISTSERWLSIAQEVLPGVQIVAGTNVYFTELNRHRPPKGFPAAYSINPQVHAFDDRSLMENLEAQSATVESARQFCEHGVVLSPITLRPRFNPNATSKTMDPEGQLPSAVDRRQRTMVGACWMAGSLAALLPCDGVVSLTYFETTGWRGLMETDLGSPLSAKFDSSPNEIFPLYYVLEFVASASSVQRLSNSLLEGVSALGLRNRDASTRYLLANLEAIPKRIRCRAAAKTIELSLLSETNLDSLRKGILPEAERLSPSEQALEFDFPGMSLALIWVKP
jgi:D-apionolactonase